MREQRLRKQRRQEAEQVQHTQVSIIAGICPASGAGLPPVFQMLCVCMCVLLYSTWSAFGTSNQPRARCTALCRGLFSSAAVATITCC